MELCCIAGCDTLAVSRGLCKRHYDSANQRVRHLLTTWDALEYAGKAKPRRYRLFHPAWCEVCNEHKSKRLVDLNTDEQSGPLYWWLCSGCADRMEVAQ